MPLSVTHNRFETVVFVEMGKLHIVKFRKALQIPLYSCYDYAWKCKKLCVVAHQSANIATAFLNLRLICGNLTKRNQKQKTILLVKYSNRMNLLQRRNTLGQMMGIYARRNSQEIVNIVTF